MKGIYYRVNNRHKNEFPKALIYPSPPAPGSVGIHTCPDVYGGMRLVFKLIFNYPFYEKKYFFEIFLKYRNGFILVQNPFFINCIIIFIINAI